MFHQTTKEVVSILRQLHTTWILWIKECISFFSEERHVTVHTATSNTIFRFRHKCRIKTMFTSDCLNNQFENLDIITSLQNICILEVDLMLTNSHFVVRCFNIESHFCQHINDFTTCVICKVSWCKVKITTFIVNFKCRITLFI